MNDETHDSVADDSEADEVRLRYKYRKLVTNGGIKLPIRLAKKLVGPDCAYQLYSQHRPGNQS